MRNWLKRCLYTLLGTALLGGVAFGVMELIASRVYHPPLPEADYPPPADLAEARRQDLDYFRHYLELERSYTDATRRRAEAIVEELAADPAALSEAEFQLGIARAVAVADNGHSNIWMGRFSRTHGRLPLRFYWFADGLYVVRAHPDYASLLGARVVAVGGQPLAEAAARLRPFVGGTEEAFRAYRGPILFELPAAHFVAGLSDSPERASLTFDLLDAGTETREIEAQSLDEEFPLFWPHNYLLSSPPEIEPDPWLPLAARVGSLPLYLQEPGATFRLHELPESGLYVQFRANVGDGIRAFTRRVRRAASDSPPAYMVIDERFNGGGDYTKTADLMFDLPDLVAGSGPIYILTGHATFSAGISSVAFARSAGGDRVIIVGERVGDRERIYGETNEFELPNSRVGMIFNTGLHDLENGCPPFPQCYYTNYFYDVAVGKLDPDVPVATRFADYMAGVDPVLRRVQALRNGDGGRRSRDPD